MNPATEDIKNILVSADVDLSFGVNLFIGSSPEQPDAVVVIFDRGGEDRAMGYSYERPFIEVVIRVERGRYRAGRLWGQRIRDALNSTTDNIQGLTRVIGVWAGGDVGFLGEDLLQRPRFSIMFAMHRTS